MTVIEKKHVFWVISSGNRNASWGPLSWVWRGVEREDREGSDRKIRLLDLKKGRERYSARGGA